MLKRILYAVLLAIHGSSAFAETPVSGSGVFGPIRITGNSIVQLGSVNVSSTTTAPATVVATIEFTISDVRADSDFEGQVAWDNNVVGYSRDGTSETVTNRRTGVVTVLGQVTATTGNHTVGIRGGGFGQSDNYQLDGRWVCTVVRYGESAAALASAVSALQGADQSIRNTMTAQSEALLDLLNAETADLQSQIDAMQARIELLESDVGTLQVQMLVQGADIEELQEDLAAANSEIAVLQGQITGHTQVLAEHQSQISATELLLEQTRTELANTQQQLSETQSELAETQTNLASTHNSLSQTQADLAGTQSELRQLQGEYRNTVQQQDQTNRQYTETIDLLTKQLTNNADTDRDLAEQVENLPNQGNYDDLLGLINDLPDSADYRSLVQRINGISNSEDGGSGGGSDVAQYAIPIGVSLGGSLLMDMFFNGGFQFSETGEHPANSEQPAKTSAPTIRKAAPVSEPKSSWFKFPSFGSQAGGSNPQPYQHKH